MATHKEKAKAKKIADRKRRLQKEALSPLPSDSPIGVSDVDEEADDNDLYAFCDDCGAIACPKCGVAVLCGNCGASFQAELYVTVRGVEFVDPTVPFVCIVCEVGYLECPSCVGEAERAAVEQVAGEQETVSEAVAPKTTPPIEDFALPTSDPLDMHLPILPEKQGV